MLFYKAWRESQTRFLVGSLALAGYCAFMILFWRQNQAPFSLRMTGHVYGEYVDNLVFGSLGKMTFVIVVVLLGLGGLMRERAHHTSAFTLALPVSRAQLVGAQIAIGLAELALLSLLPALLIQPLSAIVHQSYPIAESLRYSLLRFLCGAFIFAITFVLSSLLRREYTASLACWIALLVQARVSDWRPLRPYALNPLTTMDGRWLRGANVNDTLPWAGFPITVLITLVLFALATRISQRQDL